MSLTTFQGFVEEGTKIVKCAMQEGITVRLMGALAVRIHCPTHGHLLDEMSRAPTDIDIAAYSKDKNRLNKVLENLGYKTDIRLMSYPVYAEGGRVIYQNKTRLDVFFDRLKMCHIVSWTGRLELDNPTITPADILLEKLQIVHINLKDIKDMYILLLEHDVGTEDQDLINGRYIANLLSDDWGFYYTAKTNIEKLIALVEKSELLNSQRSKIEERARKLLNMIEMSPKSLKWKVRSKVGSKVKWYRDVVEDGSFLEIK